MSLALLLLFLGIANWLATTVLVEAEVTRDYRDWINRKYEESLGTNSSWAWYKLKYLVGCHLCTGVWVGLVMALFVPAILPTPFVGYVLTALTIKGIGHLFLVLHKLGESVSTWLNFNTEAIREDRERMMERERFELHNHIRNQVYPASAKTPDSKGAFHDSHSV